MTFVSFAFPICLALFCGLDFFLAGADQRHSIARKWPLHGGLAVAGQMVSFLIPITGIAASNASAAWGYGLGQYIRPLGWPVEFLVWTLGVTLAAYSLHFILHRYRFFWAFHRIHHCDEEMEASTSIRHHPFEDITSILTVSALAFVLTPSLSVLLATFVLTMLVDLFNHSRIEVPDRLSTALEWVIVTPRLHRVHHSPLAIQTDSNYGGTFTIWDRLFGTYRCEKAAGMGLDHEGLAGRNSRDFDTLLIEPFKFLWRGRKVIKSQGEKSAGLAD
jgi:sterol desaturase/sphingolipid hydroxylase (fatty acid hydroxylase superfamily)